MINTKKLTNILIAGTIGLTGCNNYVIAKDCFPKEKILTSSATEYLQSEGKKIEDYDLIGVKSITQFTGRYFENLCFSPSKNTEIIVSFSISGSAGHFGIGTALIPKYKKSW